MSCCIAMELGLEAALLIILVFLIHFYNAFAFAFATFKFNWFDFIPMAIPIAIPNLQRLHISNLYL